MNESITDEQVKKIINDTYTFYKKNKKFLLFRVLCVVLPFAKEDTVLPVLQDIANLFTKYKDISKDEEWDKLCEEARQIDKKYEDSDLANVTLVEILKILEARYRSKEGDKVCD